MENAGFSKEMKMIDAGKCPLCGKIISPCEFRDELSVKEYKISGMCQHCQDEIFGR